MTVRELIQELEDCDPDAEVLLAHQPEWPFEYSVQCVTVRSDADSEDDSDGEDDVTVDKDSAGMIRPNDVFICEGRQLRYADKGLWRR